jgi:hypothetical protein
MIDQDEWRNRLAINPATIKSGHDVFVKKTKPAETTTKIFPRKGFISESEFG